MANYKVGKTGKQIRNSFALDVMFVFYDRVCCVHVGGNPLTIRCCHQVNTTNKQVIVITVLIVTSFVCF